MIDLAKHESGLYRAMPLVIAVTLVAACGRAGGDSTLADAQESLAASDFDAAQIHVKSFLQREPDNPEARLLLGEIYLANDLGQAAEAEFDRAQRNGIPQARALAPLARAYALQGKCEKLAPLTEAALSGAQTAALDNAAKALVLAANGNCDLSRSDPGAARKRFEAALALDSTCAEAMVGMARVSAARTPERSLEWLGKAVSAAPNEAHAWTMLGDVRRVEGNLEGAKEAYSKAIAARPNNAYELLNRSMVNLGLGLQEEAEADISVASRKLNPTNPYVEYARGVAHLLRGSNEDARNSLSTAIAKMDNHGPTMLYLAAALLRSGKLEQAENFANKASVALPEMREARLLLAIIRAKHHDYAGALEAAGSVRGDDRVAKHCADLTTALAGNDPEQVMSAVARAENDGANLPTGFAQLGVGPANESDVDTPNDVAAAAPAPGDGKHIAALRLLQRGDIEAALNQLQALKAENPADPVTHNLLGMAFRRQGDAANARLAFQQALSLKPDFAEATNNLALTFVTAEDLEGARGVLLEGLERNPSHLGLLMVLAEIDGRRGDPPAAEATLRKVLDIQPRAVGPRVSLTRLLAGAKRNDEAIALLEQGLKVTPDNAVLLRLLATLYMEVKRPQDAIGVLANLEKVDTRNAEVPFALAQAYAAAGNEAATEASLQRALQVEPYRIAPALALVRLQLDKGKVAEASALVQRMVMSDPGNAEAQFLQGRVHLAQGNADAAVASFVQANNLMPSLPTIIALTQAQLTAGRRDDARATLEQWVAEHPKDPNARYALGEFHMVGGEEEAAIKAFKDLLEIAPNNAISLNNLAWLLRKRSPDEALGYATEALRFSPEEPAIQDTVAQVYAERGRFDEAFVLWEKARKASPGNHSYALHYADALLNAKRGDSAKAVLQEVLDSRPNENVVKAAKEMQERL